jgi:hypothetical protein
MPQSANRQPHENFLKLRCLLKNLSPRRAIQRLNFSHSAPLPERRPRHPVSVGTEPFQIYVSSRLQQIDAPRWRAWRRLRCQLEMRESTSDHCWRFDSRDDLQLAAIPALLKVDVEHSLEQPPRDALGQFFD